MFSLSIKWFIPPYLSFHSIFFCFFVFVSPIYCSIWLCHRTTIDLFIDFDMGNSNSRVASIRQRTHIESLFIGMLYHIWNHRYSKHLRICVSLELFILVINLDVMSSSNVSRTLISVFKYNVLLF